MKGPNITPCFDIRYAPLRKQTFPKIAKAMVNFDKSTLRIIAIDSNLRAVEGFTLQI